MAPLVLALCLGLVIPDQAQTVVMPEPAPAGGSKFEPIMISTVPAPAPVVGPTKSSDVEAPAVRTDYTVLFVTAFVDLKREDRPAEKYIEYFKALAASMRASNLNLVLFCEDQPTCRKVEDLTGFTNWRVMDASDTFDTLENAEKERQVMQREDYKSMVDLGWMEHYHPRYNLIQHSKTSWVRYASQLFPDYAYYAWIDFGYVRKESDAPGAQHAPNWSAIAAHKIHYASFQMFKPSDIPDRRTVVSQNNRLGIQGGAFFVPKDMTAWYESAYREEVEAFWHENLADDDQSIVQFVLKAHPDAFELHSATAWMSMFYEIVM